MKYTFNNRVFNSKKEVDAYIRSVKDDHLNSGENSVIGCGHKLFPFFKELIDIHNDKTEKIGSGIDFFYFVKDCYGHDQMRICRTDKSTIDCSCIYSKITQRNVNINYNDDLKNALRHAIKSQTFDFFKKQGDNLSCCICGDTNKCEIDHVVPFHYIKSEFLKKIENKDIPTEFDDNINGTCSRIFKEKDFKFTERWKLFHKDMAIYQVLCKACNSKKSGKYNIG